MEKNKQTILTTGLDIHPYKEDLLAFHGWRGSNVVELPPMVNWTLKHSAMLTVVCYSQLTPAPSSHSALLFPTCVK